MTKPEALSDPDLERTLLAALIADNRGFDQIGHLEPDDLSHPMHGAVLTAALDMRAEKSCGQRRHAAQQVRGGAVWRRRQRARLSEVLRVRR